MQPHLDEITDKISGDFLREIKQNNLNIDFDTITDKLKLKYTQEGHSAMILDGRKGIRVIVDHGIDEHQSEINCKTEIKIFEKCGMKVTNHTIKEKVYSYVVQPEEEFYKELEKIPDSQWNAMSVTRTISQDILGEIEKTAAKIGFTLKDVLQLMAENTHITELRSKMK